MATVYLALDRRLDREVALKVLLGHLAVDDDFVTRFLREARSAARLSHPNVVQVFDQGSDGSMLYLAMEYLPGQTLRQALAERGALTPREALAVIEPVLDALSAAHRAGIIHRDIKPENVILTDDGRVKVADFGLARAVAGNGLGAMNTAERLIGTVAYLAPELISRGVADARADVYAAGILLFEMLTGRQPFSGADPVEVAHRHVRESVPSPSTLVAGVPRELDDLVAIATGRDPDDRPPDAGKMLALVRAMRMRLPVEMLDDRPQVPPVVPAGATQEVPPLHLENMTRTLPAEAAPPPWYDAPTAVTPPAAGERDDAAGESGALAEFDAHVRAEMARRRRRGTVLLTGVVTVALILAGFGWWFVAGPGATTTVPEIVAGTPVDSARSMLSQVGLNSKEVEAYDDKVPEGQVISTRPSGGTEIRKGGSVTLVISLGPEFVEVPSVRRKPVDEAKAEIEEADLVVGKTPERYSDQVGKGRVISSNPAAGESVARKSEVDLVVSKGPRPIPVPNVVGQPRQQAIDAVTAAGFKAEIVEVDASEGQPTGVVIGQDPASGELRKGGTVTITVTRGESQVEVPNVIGQDWEQAEEILKDAGLNPRREGPDDLGRVVATNPGPGTVVPFDSEITVFVI
jgi:serine/threonine-protein kinase